MSQHDRFLRRQAMAEEISDGMTPHTAAYKYGVRLENVYRIMREFGVVVPSKTHHDFW